LIFASVEINKAARENWLEKQVVLAQKQMYAKKKMRYHYFKICSTI